jgi:microsomal dipeptidase-like Zn-dependent dipeptidase
MKTPGKLTRRDFLRGAGRVATVGSALMPGLYAATARSSGDAADRLAEARALHRKIPVFLGYCVFHAEQFQAKDGRQCDLEKLDTAGVRTFVASVGFGYGSPRQPYFQTGPREYALAGSDEWLRRRQLERIDELVTTIKRCPRTRLVTCARDLAPRQDDTIGVVVHLIGNNHMVDLEAVDTFFRRGVRACHPAMEYHSRWCSSQAGLAGPVLTAFGRQAVARMNERGIVLDTAHASDASAVAIIEASSKPVIDGHTTSRDRVPQSRGLRDATLRRIAQGGGVVGIHFADHMLTTEAWRKKYGRRPAHPRIWEYHKHVLQQTDDPEERIRLRNDKEMQEKFFRDHRLPPEPPLPAIRAATLGQLADAIDYLVKLLGIDHVGIGGDVNGIDDDSWPEGMDHVGHLPRLTAELLRRRYTEERLRKLWSDNWRRVYAKCLPAMSG